MDKAWRAKGSACRCTEDLSANSAKREHSPRPSARHRILVQENMLVERCATDANGREQRPFAGTMVWGWMADTRELVRNLVHATPSRFFAVRVRQRCKHEGAHPTEHRNNSLFPDTNDVRRICAFNIDAPPSMAPARRNRGHRRVAFDGPVPRYQRVPA